MKNKSFSVLLLICLLTAGPCFGEGQGADSELDVRLVDWYAIGPFARQCKSSPLRASENKPESHGDRIQRRRLLGELLARASSTCPMDPSNGGIIGLDDPYGPARPKTDQGVETLQRWQATSVDSALMGDFPFQSNTVGVVYFSTWVYAPTNMAVKIIMGRPISTNAPVSARQDAIVHVWINGYGLRAESPDPKMPVLQRPVQRQDAYFRNGWNHILCRHASASGRIDNALVLRVRSDLAPAILTTRDPPEGLGRVFSFGGVGVFPKWPRVKNAE